METAPLLSVVVPVLNESANLPELHRRLSEVVAGIRQAEDAAFDFSITIQDGSDAFPCRILLLGLCRSAKGEDRYQTNGKRA